eukprot:scaffold9663_cov39-Phaeocystis_antarctica.AAC.2
MPHTGLEPQASRQASRGPRAGSLTGRPSGVGEAGGLLPLTRTRTLTLTLTRPSDVGQAGGLLPDGRRGAGLRLQRDGQPDLIPWGAVRRGAARYLVITPRAPSTAPATARCGDYSLLTTHC